MCNGTGVKLAEKIARHIDLKHHITETGRLVKTGNDVEVPKDEPLILFRGRDRLALPMLKHYRELCIADGCNDFQMAQMDEIMKKFEDFAATSETMKQPGITRGK